jgi:DNA-binding ferritin-like protein (Dps family)
MMIKRRTMKALKKMQGMMRRRMIRRNQKRMRKMKNSMRRRKKNIQKNKWKAQKCSNKNLEELLLQGHTVAKCARHKE